jgi:hypothetical protein
MGVGLFALGAIGCTDDCQALSEDICFCQATQAAQQACIQRITTQSSTIKPTATQRKHCAEILDAGTCKCTALAKGDYAACGLTSPGGLPGE